MRARDNPFAVERVLRLRYRFFEGSREELQARLSSLNYRGAIVGEEGCGKTTLLEDLAARLASEGFRIRQVTVSAEERRLSAAQRHALLAGAGKKDLLLLDGADALSRLAWRSVRHMSRRAGGLIVTAHREGLLPTLWPVSTRPELLSELILALTGREPEAFGRSAEELFERHGGNLRNALRELYDVCASWPDVPAAEDHVPQYIYCSSAAHRMAGGPGDSQRTRNP